MHAQCPPCQLAISHTHIYTCTSKALSTFLHAHTHTHVCSSYVTLFGGAQDAWSNAPQLMSCYLPMTPFHHQATQFACKNFGCWATANKHKHTHTNTHAHTHTHTHTHARTHMHARTHARTHTHTHTNRPSIESSCSLTFSIA